MEEPAIIEEPPARYEVEIKMAPTDEDSPLVEAPTVPATAPACAGSAAHFGTCSGSRASNSDGGYA
jgi:hypothetical protein